MPSGLTESHVHNFQEHPAWIEITKRISNELSKHRDKAIDASDARSAGWVRALEMVVKMPDILLAEIEREDKSLGRRLLGRRI